MKLVTAEQMRGLDRRTIEEFGVTGEELMEHAGGGVAETVQYLARVAGLDQPTVLLVAGRGNNGGDAFVAARYLAKVDLEVEVWLAGDAQAVRGDALKQLSRMRSAGVNLREMPTRNEWEEAMRSPRGFDVVVDGILGTGLSGAARGPAASAIQCVNLLSDSGLVVAVDVPSGLNADSGQAEGGAVTADVTASLGLPKRGLVEPCAVECVGTVEVVDIGIPPELVEGVESDLELITPRDVGQLLARRRRSAHKGMFGHVLVVGGAAGFAGAAALACRGALRSGAGLVSALVPEPVAGVVAGMAPEAMVHGGPATESGSLRADALDRWGRDLAQFDAVLVGPGMTRHEASGKLLGQVLRTRRGVVVADADALNSCAGNPEALAAGCPLVITPHPGEMARLLCRTAADVQAARVATAREMAERTKAVTVLKGAGTVVAAAGRNAHVNLTGNPGMATGGMGDVLAGMIAGLAGQGLAPFDAARAAVYLHGRAGDNVAWRSSQTGMTAGDVVEELPHAFRDLAAR